MKNSSKEIIKIAKDAKKASMEMPGVPVGQKNEALELMIQGLGAAEDKILKVNLKDLGIAKRNGLAAAMLERLTLDPKRITQMADSLKEIAKLDDPVGKIILKWTRPNGLEIRKVRVPIGVICIIYESRPNVTADCVGLCLKSSNTLILRGGSEAFYSNKAIFDILQSACLKAGLPKNCINFVDTTDREAVDLLLQQDAFIDLVIPRGGEGLIKLVAEKSKIPVIKHYKGICHVYVDSEADLNMAHNICLNAKLQRPGVCNAMETLLVHKDVAIRFLPVLANAYKKANVELRGCKKTCKIVKGIKAAVDKDWITEYLDLILSIKVVDSKEEAIDHINTYGSHHSDSIVTSNEENAQKFLRDVDSACVYKNASTRFTDGYEFGMGAEMGISTDKLHARGPMALEELTTYKYIIYGNGQVKTG